MYDEGEPLPIYEHRYLEENVWRSIRWGLDWELIDFAAQRSVPAPDRVRALIELCGPEIDALGLAPYLPPLERILAEGDNASRYIRRIEAGETAPRDLRRAGRADALVGRAGSGGAMSEDEVRAALDELASIPVEQLLVGTIQTLVNVTLHAPRAGRGHRGSDRSRAGAHRHRRDRRAGERRRAAHAARRRERAAQRAGVAAAGVRRRAGDDPAAGGGGGPPPPPPPPPEPERPPIWTPRGNV